MSAAETFAQLDYGKLLRLGAWVAFCVLLLVLA